MSIDTLASHVPPVSLSSGRYQHLDAMRGIAALAVVYFHIALESSQAGMAIGHFEGAVFFLTTKIFDLGKIAVIVFFAISGYVLPFSLLRDGTGVKRSFVIGRIFRLYPAYWVSMMCAAVFMFHLNGIALPGKTFLANLTMLQGFVRQPDMIGVYWTLQIEIIFYALCLVLALAGVLSKTRAISLCYYSFLLVSIIMAAVRYKTAMKLPVALPLSIAIMFFGMMWRLNGQAGIENSRKIIATHLVFMAIAVPIVSVLAYSVNYGFDETWYRYVISYYTAIVLFLVFSTIVKLQYRTLTYLGLISYSVYLFGPVVQAAVTLAMPRLAAGAFSEHLFILVVLVLTVGVASGVYHLVEVPSIALGKRLALRLIHRARVPTAVPFETPL